MASGNGRINRRRDTPPLRSLKRVGLLFTASIIAGVEVDQALSYFGSVATLPPPLMALMPAPSLLVGEDTQREARHAGALNGD